MTDLTDQMDIICEGLFTGDRRKALDALLEAVRQKAYREGAHWMYEIIMAKRVAGKGKKAEHVDYKQRLVARTELPWGTLTTVQARSDGWLPYETAISAAEFDNGAPIVIASHATREEAAAGHAKMAEVTAVTGLPTDEVTDISNSKLHARDYRRVVQRRKSEAEVTTDAAAQEEAKDALKQQVVSNLSMPA